MISKQEKIRTIKKKYEESFQKNYEDMSKAMIGISIANMCVFFENDETRKKINQLITNLLNANDSETAKKTKNSLQEILLHQIKNSTFRNMNQKEYTLTEKIQEEMDLYYFEGDMNKIKAISDEIANTVAADPVNAIITFVDIYIKAFENLEELKRIKDTALKELEESIIYNKRYNPTFKASNGTDEKPIKPTQLTQKNLIRELQEELFNPTGYVNESLSKHIVDYYKLKDQKFVSQIPFYNSLFTYDFEFLGQENINNIFTFYVIANRENNKNTHLEIINSYHDMIKLGELAAKINYTDLKCGLNFSAELSDLGQFIERFNPHEILEQYEQLRKKFITMFEKLSIEDRRKVDKKIHESPYAKEYENYRKRFGITGNSGKDIATADQIKKYINKQIVDYYLEENKFYQQSHQPLISITFIGQITGKDPWLTQKFGYSLKHMSAKEIADFYTTLINKKHEEINSNDLPNIQLLFAKTIRNRISTSQKIDDLAIEERNNKKYLIQIEKELIAICKDYLHEEPLFETTFVKSSEVENNYAIPRVDTSEAIKNAQRRYFGMSKFEQVLSILDYNKLMRLSNSEVLSNQDIEEINRMFGGKK